MGGISANAAKDGTACRVKAIWTRVLHYAGKVTNRDFEATQLPGGAKREGNLLGTRRWPRSPLWSPSLFF